MMGKQELNVTFCDGTNNNFIIYDFLDRFERNFPLKAMKSHYSTHKNYGVDSGLVLTRVLTIRLKVKGLMKKFHVPSNSLIVNMYVYEPGDGFCGNGSRCVGRYLHESYPGYDAYYIECAGYLHKLMPFESELFPSGPQYCTEMGVPEFSIDRAKAAGLYNGPLYYSCGGLDFQFCFASEPHLVCILEESANFEEYTETLCKVGLEINQLTPAKKSKKENPFPVGINCSILQKIGPDSLKFVVFERGINRLTQACGSGSVCASAVARRAGLIAPEVDVVKVFLPGGLLCIREEGTTGDKKVYLCGDSRLLVSVTKTIEYY